MLFFVFQTVELELYLKLITDNVGSILRTLPKNSVTNTFLISLENKSVRYETVEMHL